MGCFIKNCRFSLLIINIELYIYLKVSWNFGSVRLRQDVEPTRGQSPTSSDHMSKKLSPAQIHRLNWAHQEAQPSGSLLSHIAPFPKNPHHPLYPFFSPENKIQNSEAPLRWGRTSQQHTHNEHVIIQQRPWSLVSSFTLLGAPSPKNLSSPTSLLNFAC